VSRTNIVQQRLQLVVAASLLRRSDSRLRASSRVFQRGDLLDDVLGLEISSFLNCSSTPAGCRRP